MDNKTYQVVDFKPCQLRQNKISFLLFFKLADINCQAYRIWKSQKDFRLSATEYLNTLSEKNFHNDDEIKQKLLKNKKYYFHKLEQLTLKKNKTLNRFQAQKDQLIKQEISQNQALIENLNQNIVALENQYNSDTQTLIYSYHLMNYYIQYKPYFVNQTIDEKIIAIKNHKLHKYDKKIARLNHLITKLNEKLDALVHPVPKTKMNKNQELVQITKAPVDLNKPNKKALNIMNSISVYETKKQKYINQRLNVEHHFDLIHQQWQRNEFHELITNPFYKTKA